MQHVNCPFVLGLLAIMSACGNEPEGPDEIDMTDASQTRGTELASGESVPSSSKLVWVPGTELVAFTSWEPTGEGCAIKTVDAVSGSTNVVDDDCVSINVHLEAYFRMLVAAADGSRLYYTVGVGDPLNVEWVLRSADATGGDTITLRDSVPGSALAVSTDGQLLAYRARPATEDDVDSLMVRNLVSGNETHHPDPVGDPIVFSADGTELLYETMEGVSLLRVLRRWSLDTGVDQLVSIPEGRARLFYWGVDGIQVLAEVLEEYPSQYHVLNLSTGASAQVSLIQSGEDVPYQQLVWGNEAWSADGTQVAYWTATCFSWAGLFDCDVERRSLYVADTRTGDRERVVNTSDGSGPVAFSPDGTRLVYFSSPPAQVEGRFYLVELP